MIRDSTREFILHLSDEEMKNQDRRQFLDILQHLREISDDIEDVEEVNRFVDTFRLDVAFKWFLNQISIEVRLDGIRDMREMIVLMHRRDHLKRT